MKYILVRQDDQIEFNQLPIIKKRLDENNYISIAGKKKEQAFYDKVSAKLAMLEWVDEHYNEFKVFPCNNGGNYRKLAIKLPFYDDKTKKVVPIEGTITICRHMDNCVEKWRNKLYDSIYMSLDFRGRRLDWEEELFADILAHQDNFGEWCKSYTESINCTEYPYMIK